MMQRNFRPFDHLIMEWYHNETPESQNTDRFSAVGRYNLFEHAGGQASTPDIIQTLNFRNVWNLFLIF